LQVPELGKIVGEEWRALSEKKKEKYVAMAAKDKARHDTEMAKYTPPPDAATAAVGAQPAVGFAPGLIPRGPRSHEAAWEMQLARLAAHNAEHSDCNVPQSEFENDGCKLPSPFLDWAGLET
jgi:hypothetical protein